MSFLNLFTWHYWLAQPYIAHGWTMGFWVIGFLVFLLAGLVARIITAKRAKTPVINVWNRLANSCLLFGFFGLVWMFMRQERVPFLAWRFWLWIPLAHFCWTVFKTIKFFVARYPKIKIERAQREIKEKYLSVGK